MPRGTLQTDPHTKLFNPKFQSFVKVVATWHINFTKFLGRVRMYSGFQPGVQNLTIKLIVRVRDTRTRSNLTPYAYDTCTGIAYRYAYKIKFLHELRADKILLIVYSVTQKRKCNLIVPVRDTGTRIKYRYAIPVRYRYAVRVRVRLTYRNLTTRMRLNFANPVEIQNT